MIAVSYNRGLIKMIDLYGSTNPDKEKNVDIIISSSVILPEEGKEDLMIPKGVVHSFGKTLVINLQRPEEEIFGEIHKNAKYKINRAAKRDSIFYHELTSPTDEEITDFVLFFDDFSSHKKIPRANLGRLKGLRDQHSLIISYVTDENENALCYHAYVKTDNQCALLYSASARFNNSEMRNLIGRANRYLHWQDIKSFRKMGHEWFDFGGIFVNPNEDGEKFINRFKMEFGGQVVDEVRKFHSFTILGKIVVFMFWLKMRKRPDFLRARMNRRRTIALRNS